MFQRQTAAADAAIQPVPQPLKVRNPLFDLLCESLCNACPVGLAQRLVRWQVGQMRGDLGQRKAQSLRGDDKGQTADIGSGIAPVPAIIAQWRKDPVGLVKRIADTASPVRRARSPMVNPCEASAAIISLI